MGFRNPFRMTVDKRTGYVYLGEYGPDAGGANPNRGPGGIVEFNQIREAGNFGWPYCTGSNTPAETYNEWDFATNTTGPKFDCTAPVNNSPHNTGLTNLPPAQPAWIKYDGGNVTYNGVTTNEFGGGGEGPMAGPVYNFDPDLESDVKFPEYFDNHFFAGEWTRGWIRDIAMDAEGDVVGIDPFFDSMTLYAAMDMEFGPDGSLYVLDYGNGGYFTGNENSAVYKINAINEGARSPSASATATPDTGAAPLVGDVLQRGLERPRRGGLDRQLRLGLPERRHRRLDRAQPDVRLHGQRRVRRPPDRHRLHRPHRRGHRGGHGRQHPAGRRDRAAAQRRVLRVRRLRPGEGQRDRPRGRSDRLLQGEDRLHPRPRLARPPAQLRAPAATSSCRPCRTRATTPRRTSSASSTPATPTSGAGGVRTLTGEDEVVLQPKRKQAEHFTTQQGVATEATTDPLGGSRNLSNIDAGDHVSYAPISLSGVPRLRFRVASAGAGGTIEARLDSPTGPLAGSVAVPVTGGWQQWQFVDMDIAESAQQGSHELFLVFTNANPVGHRACSTSTSSTLPARGSRSTRSRRWARRARPPRARLR